MAEIKFLAWNPTDKKTESRYFLTFKDLSALNMLGQTYHSAFGYTTDPILDDNEPYHWDMFSDMFYVDEEEKYVVPTYPNLIKRTCEEYTLRHKLIVLRAFPKKCEFDFTPLTKTNKLCFYGKSDIAKYWYEFPSVTFTTRDKTCTLLPPLSSRSYIHVTDLFLEITINSEEKGSPITIDDVLFASRGLCWDDTRGINCFNVLSDNGSRLVLMPDIDNWST